MDHVPRHFTGTAGHKSQLEWEIRTEQKNSGSRKKEGGASSTDLLGSLTESHPSASSLVNHRLPSPVGRALQPPFKFKPSPTKLGKKHV